MTRTLKLTLLLALAICVAGMAVAQTSSTTVVHRTGTVLAKYDGKVAVQMDDGTVKEFTPKPGKTIMVDGKETGYADLKVGTVLSADFVKTTTTVPVETTTIKNATVTKVVANTLVVQNEQGFKSYTIPSDFKFLVEGKETSITDLRPGMKLTATIVSKSTKTLTEAEVKGVGGTGPAAPAAAPAPPPPAPAAAPAPAPEPAPAPAEKKLPKTGSPLPLAALGGALSLLAGLGLRFRRTR